MQLKWPVTNAILRFNYDSAVTSAAWTEVN